MWEMWGAQGWAQLLALPLAWAAYRVGHNIWSGWRQARANRSPIDVTLVLSWITLHVRRDTDPDTDTEPATGSGRGKRYVQETDTYTRIERVDLGKDPLPTATPTPRVGNSNLQLFIQRSYEQGARYSDIVRDGSRMFGKSEATIKRAIRDYQRAAKKAKAGQ